MFNNENNIKISMDEKEQIEPLEISDAKKKFNGLFKSNRIICRAWLLGENGSRDKLIDKPKKVKVGKTFFVAGGKRYFINYDELREGKKHYEYDTNALNAVGSLSWHDTEKNNPVSPTQADLMLKDGMVKTFMGKGGIPVMYLLVAMIVVSIALAGVMYCVSQLQTLQAQLTNQIAQNTALKTENQALKTQIQTGAIG